MSESKKSGGLAELATENEENFEKADGGKKLDRRFGKNDDSEKDQGNLTEKFGLVIEGKDRRNKETCVKNEDLEFRQYRIHSRVLFAADLISSAL